MTNTTEPRRVVLKPAIDPETKEPMVVRHPSDMANPLPKEGRAVVLDSYWVRRLRDQSVTSDELQAQTQEAPRDRAPAKR